MKSRIVFSIFLFIALCFSEFAVSSFCADADKVPDGFVDIKEMILDIQLDIRYFGSHNFVGERVDWLPGAKMFPDKRSGRSALLTSRKI